MRIFFDMDGTFVNLYGIENWLEDLQEENVRPYRDAKPLINMNVFARRLNEMKRHGFEIGVISWTSKNSSEEYAERVTKTKKDWLNKHLKSVEWDTIEIVPYGTPKENFMKDETDVLFDDEERNRKNWKGVAYDVNEIFTTLKEIEKSAQADFLF